MTCLGCAQNKGEYAIQQKLETITVLGVQRPVQVIFQRQIEGARVDL